MGVQGRDHSAMIAFYRGEEFVAIAVLVSRSCPLTKGNSSITGASLPQRSSPPAIPPSVSPGRPTGPAARGSHPTPMAAVFLHAFGNARHVRLAGERAPDPRHRPLLDPRRQDLRLPRR